MANIKDLKKKIKSTKGTLKITEAMKLVSAAKLNKAQNAILNARPYANELEDSIKTISALVEGYNHSFLNNNESKKEVLLVISSNKGLCGGYNSGLAKAVKAYIANHEDTNNLEVHFIGTKVKELVVKLVNAGESYGFERTEPQFHEVQTIANKLSELFATGEVGKVSVAYNIFHSAIQIEPTVKQVLPMTLDSSERDELKEKYPFDFRYNPGAESILDGLIPEAYTSAMWTAVLDATAAEHGSRMSAMDSAVGNCKDAIRTLTIKMNKLRQAAITTELIEVVSGAESLNG
ncbi:ATP synthase F1 subunit gamma [Halobacteriovorax sp. XZX-3]|uniref:ATP synthase F1 subunit gamma n=1 Tax=unclassified Halobacteriovorax TaxID=2639665 RepID=UPI000CD20AD0|nr:ATP synthase F1 subunit gamma [Halobacteriovorax sp. DA5]POB13233.1 ATP synthase F1 subunit gamma [Halobacteriovorax sp. DA5]